MDSTVNLLLVYETPGGRPLTVARIDDRTLVTKAATAALTAADARAEHLTEVDRTLGLVQREEANRLRRVLNLLVPELSHRTPARTQ